MTRPILYTFRRCPYAMRARMALLVAGVEVEQREIILREKPADMLAASPKGTVPVLILPDGSVIDESLDIMQWALGQHDPQAWLSGDDKAVIVNNDGPFKHHLDRTKYPHRYHEDPVPHREAAIAMLKDIEQRLETADYLSGEAPKLADFATFPFIRQFAAIDPDWFALQGLAKLLVWLEAMSDTMVFKNAMQRPPCWTPGQGVLILGHYQDSGHS